MQGGRVKYLAIDWGEKRMGVAVSEGSLAFPRPTIAVTGSEAVFAALAALVEAEKPDGLVVGLPLSLAGEETPSSEKVRRFARQLLGRFRLPVWLMPETLSSCAADVLLAEARVRPRRRKAILDAQAACLILDSFLRQPKDRRLKAWE